MFKKFAAIASISVLVGLIFSLLSGGRAVNQAQAAALPAVPAGLKSTFMLGLGNGPGNIGWMAGSGASWDARYQYLSAGANTGNGWANWNSPAGMFASYYMDDSASKGIMPVLTYYMLLQSAPGVGANEGEKNYNNLNNTSTMNAYYADFKLLMDRARIFGKTVIVHVEPDLWGFLQQRNNNPNNLSASVASSGYPGLGALPNTASGFAKALVQLRNTFAPNVVLAYHVSPWSSNKGWMGSTDPNMDVNAVAQDIGNYYLQLGANFDLLFYDIADRDAALYASWGNNSAWLDASNQTFPNFNRYNQLFSGITAVTGKRGVIWQIPVGNTLYRTMNNTRNHWQDNKVQYYLGADNNLKIQELVNSGIIGLFYGAGDGETTTPYDGAGDGITNPAPINNNNLVSSYPDDDGGLLRLRAQAYYSRGAVSLGGSAPVAPTATPTAAPTATPTAAPTATPTAAPTAAPGSTGTGLNAAYFANKTLTGTPALQRVDPTINFNWGTGSPGTGVPVDGFSARWTGQVKAPATAAYTFCTSSDDGVRLWVNNVQLVNNWTDHGPTENCGQISLTQGQLYGLTMEYYENTGGAVATLSWQTPALARQIVPQSQLYPATAAAPAPTATPTQAPTATPTAAPAAPANWVMTGNTTGTFTAGSTLTINSNFQAPVNTSGSYILDVEVYNLATGAKVAQWTSTQSFVPGQVRTMTNTWQVPAAGQYQVRLGTFTTAWTFLAWQGNASTFTVN